MIMEFNPEQGAHICELILRKLVVCPRNTYILKRSFDPRSGARARGPTPPVPRAGAAGRGPKSRRDNGLRGAETEASSLLLVVKARRVADCCGRNRSLLLSVNSPKFLLMGRACTCAGARVSGPAHALAPAGTRATLPS